MQSLGLLLADQVRQTIIWKKLYNINKTELNCLIKLSIGKFRTGYNYLKKKIDLPAEIVSQEILWNILLSK